MHTVLHTVRTHLLPEKCAQIVKADLARGRCAQVLHGDAANVAREELQLAAVLNILHQCAVLGQHRQGLLAGRTQGTYRAVHDGGEERKCVTNG